MSFHLFCAMTFIYRYRFNDETMTIRYDQRLMYQAAFLHVIKKQLGIKKPLSIYYNGKLLRSSSIIYSNDERFIYDVTQKNNSIRNTHHQNEEEIIQDEEQETVKQNEQELEQNELHKQEQEVDINLVSRFTSEGIKNAFPLSDEMIVNNEFDIIVDNEVIKTNIILASFISPIITKNIMADKTCRTLEIQLNSYLDDYEQFQLSFANLAILPHLKSQFSQQISTIEFNKMFVEKLKEILQMMKEGEISNFISMISNFFQKIQSTREKDIVLEFFVLIKIFVSFGNDFIIQLLTESFLKLYNQDIEINEEEELIKIIKIKKSITNGKILIEDYKKEIQYIQDNFLQMDPQIINEIDEILIEKAITSNRFQINDEDNFFYQIIKLKDEYAQYFLRFVVFSNLSYSAIGFFLKSFSLYDIDEQIWKSLSNRLLLPSDENSFVSNRSTFNNFRILDKTFNYSKGHELEGLFDYLNKTYNGNAHLKKIIEITSNGDEFNHCYNLIDRDFSSYFYPKESDSAFIQFNFKRFKFSLNSYSLKSNQNQTNKLINWEIIGSNDLKNWYQIDEEHIGTWNSNFNIKNYQTKNSQAYQYIQIRLKGNDSSGENYLDLSGVEFFGSIQ